MKSYNKDIEVKDMKKDRGKVWLGVAGVTVNQLGQWLVVKKKHIVVYMDVGHYLLVLSMQVKQLMKQLYEK